MSLLPENRLLVAMENAQVKIFDTSEKTFENPVSLKTPTEEGKTWAGFGLAEDTIVGAGSDGVVHTWSLEKLSDLSNMVRFKFCKLRFYLQILHKIVPSKILVSCIFLQK